jgi:hypothetical protein
MPKAESPGALRPTEIARVVNATRATKKKLPPLSAKSMKRPPDGRYREQYGLIVICPNAAVQQALYEALRTLGHCKLRVVTT